MSEKSMRDTMRRHFAQVPGLHWQRIEDALQAGIPDINICHRGVEFWIEAKQMDTDKLPKRPTTPVRIGLRAEQRAWLWERRIADGNALVVFKLGNEWFIFNRYFDELFEGRTLDSLRQMAHKNWTGPFDPVNVLGVVK